MKKPVPIQKKFVVLFRGINVGGNNIVPMAFLKKEFEKHGFRNVHTILNSGNVIFETSSQKEDEILAEINSILKKNFIFLVPAILISFSGIEKIVEENPFKKILITPDLRLYVTFTNGSSMSTLSIPYKSSDESFRLIRILGDSIFSVLDVSKNKTPTAMSILEKEYGKNITTRNWNTVIKIWKAGRGVKGKRLK